MHTGPMPAKKMVGAYIPRPSSSHLALIALHSDKSITQILTEIINDYDQTHDREKLINEAAGKNVKQWKELIVVNAKDPQWRSDKKKWEQWGKYKYNIGHALKKRGVDTPDIFMILTAMDTIVKVKKA